MRAVSLAASALLLVSVGCGSASNSTGAISGQVTITGGAVAPQNHRAPPIRSTLLLIDSQGHRVDAKPVRSGDGYDFSDVTPGHYHLAFKHIDGCGRPVRVEEGQTTRAAVNCPLP